jgi:hypothetical protein
VFAAVQKPPTFVERPTQDMALWSVLTGRRTRSIRQSEVWRVRLSSPRRIASALLPHNVKTAIWRMMPRPLRERLGRHRKPIPEGGVCR